MIWLLD